MYGFAVTKPQAVPCAVAVQESSGKASSRDLWAPARDAQGVGWWGWGTFRNEGIEMSRSKVELNTTNSQSCMQADNLKICSLVHLFYILKYIL